MVARSGKRKRGLTVGFVRWLGRTAFSLDRAASASGHVPPGYASHAQAFPPGRLCSSSMGRPAEIGSPHVCTPVTHPNPVRHLPLRKTHHPHNPPTTPPIL